MLSKDDVAVLTKFLWVDDKHKYDHERYRIQLCLFIQLLAYTASRPGAIIESDAYRNSNMALKYKDFKLWFLRPRDGGPPRLSLTIRFSYMKGCREEDGDDNDGVVCGGGDSTDDDVENDGCGGNGSTEDEENNVEIADDDEAPCV